MTNARPKATLLERHRNCTHRRLTGETDHAVDSNINSVGAGRSSDGHRSRGDASGIVRVDVDRQVGVLLVDSADEGAGSLGLEQTGHVLDAENVDAFAAELADEVEEVLEGVLGLLLARNIAGVAHDGFNDATGLLRRVDTELHVLCGPSLYTCSSSGKRSSGER